jgi:hypothetical protein
MRLTFSLVSMLWLMSRLKQKEIIECWQLHVFVYHYFFFPCAVGNVNGTGKLLCMSGLLMLSELSEEE